MEIQIETNSIREEINRGTLIDLQNRLYFIDSVNSKTNREVKGKLEFMLYEEGYLPYFNAINSIDLRGLSRDVRAFYIDVDESCKLYVSTNPNNNAYELRYIVYNEEISISSLRKIIKQLEKLKMLITFVEKAS